MCNCSCSKPPQDDTEDKILKFAETVYAKAQKEEDVARDRISSVLLASSFVFGLIGGSFAIVHDSIETGAARVLFFTGLAIILVFGLIFPTGIRWYVPRRSLYQPHTPNTVFAI